VVLNSHQVETRSTHTLLFGGNWVTPYAICRCGRDNIEQARAAHGLGGINSGHDVPTWTSRTTHPLVELAVSGSCHACQFKRARRTNLVRTYSTVGSFPSLYSFKKSDTDITCPIVNVSTSTYYSHEDSVLLSVATLHLSSSTYVMPTLVAPIFHLYSFCSLSHTHSRSPLALFHLSSHCSWYIFSPHTHPPPFWYFSMRRWLKS
jgi:hypothetical protein